jgi:medium-chain acyl-[acyl-carrier-protein] hydrolase
MIIEEVYRPVIEDCTKTGKVSICGIVKAFENLGSRHSELVGDSVFKSGGNTKAWILTDWQIEIVSYPYYADEIKVQTWSQELKSPLVASRDFLLTSGSKPCVKGTTRWVLYDLAAARPCKIEKELLDKYKPEQTAVFENQRLEKIVEPVQYSYEKRIAVRRGDIDFNDHLHNLVYLDYAMETIPEDLYAAQEFKKLRITYRTAIKSDTEVVAKYAHTGENHIVSVYDFAGSLKAMIQLS